MASEKNLVKKSSKKEVKKASKPAGTKKVTRRKRKSTNSPIESGIYHDTEQVYKALNRVQITREPVTFIIKETESPVIDNILKDLGLPFKKKKAKAEGFACYDYTVSPGKEVPRTDHLDDIEELPDEIIEDGQVFF